MEDFRTFPFAGNLDPRAQEFVPAPLNPMSSRFHFPYTSLPPPLPPPPPSYGLSPSDPRMFTFFNIPPHPMMFPPAPHPPPPPPPRPWFNGFQLFNGYLRRRTRRRDHFL
ncbi:hypothetical protein Bca52824_068557 [Brassica carinata]|uniref:Uncharacterized protein n=1 Tax=Brassica carinata TaxID=52824 RepID=A0A8X7Q214_BRACI|nr:hypothetical protein Bca52824_068557 [Brassica carinata]